MPTLSVNAATPPVIGTTFELIRTNVPVALLNTFGAYGYSRDQWLGVPLPLSLAPANLPGCFLLQNTQQSFSLSLPFNGTVVWPVTLPNDLSTLGDEVYFQALHLEVPGYPRWASLTNGVAISIGQY